MEGNANTTEATRPSCIVTPLPGIGERRRYKGVVQPFAAHSHDHYVIGLVEEGTRALVCNGQALILSPGDLVAFNPGAVHSCEQHDGGTFAYDSLAIQRELLDGARLIGPKVTDLDAVEAFRHASQAADSGECARLRECVRQLCELFLADDQGRIGNRNDDDAACRVLAHFCGNLSKPDTLRKLAATEGISQYSLIRAYKGRYSITPMRHLASLRVECAARLLGQGVSPAVVATEVGFCDQAHLTRAFRQRMGTTPAAYRAMTHGSGPLA